VAGPNHWRRHHRAPRQDRGGRALHPSTFRLNVTHILWVGYAGWRQYVSDKSGSG
jgi:hypothetical protein